MRAAIAILGALLLAAPVAAQPKGKARPAATKAKAAKAAKGKAVKTDRQKGRTRAGKQVTLEDGRKVKAYSFGMVDLEGRLKTPQLLYFLNRVKVELDSTNDARRSFVKELKATADEKGL